MTDLDYWPFDSECPECGHGGDIAAHVTVKDTEGPIEATLVCENCLHEWKWSREDDV